MVVVVVMRCGGRLFSSALFVICLVGQLQELAACLVVPGCRLYEKGWVCQSASMETFLHDLSEFVVVVVVVVVVVLAMSACAGNVSIEVDWRDKKGSTHAA